MAKTLPANLILEKNKVESSAVWMLIADIDLNGVMFYITDNNEDVTYGGNVYTSFPFTISSMDNNSSGKVPSLSMNVSNVTKGIMQYVEASNGLVNSEVVIRVVNSAHLTEDYSELTLEYTILSTSVTAEWISFKLGAPNPMMQRYPRDRYVAKYCNWLFKSVECAYTGVDTTCDRTKDACELKGNLLRFGGYPGLSENGLRVIK